MKKRIVLLIVLLLSLLVVRHSTWWPPNWIMFSAAERGDAGTVTSTLKFGASVHTRLGFWDRYETALHRSALYRHTQVVRVLLDNGADVNAWTEGRDGTPLTYTILGGDVEIVKLL